MMVNANEHQLVYRIKFDYKKTWKLRIYFDREIGISASGRCAACVLGNFP